MLFFTYIYIGLLFARPSRLHLIIHHLVYHYSIATINPTSPATDATLNISF